MNLTYNSPHIWRHITPGTGRKLTEGTRTLEMRQSEDQNQGIFWTTVVVVYFSNYTMIIVSHTITEVHFTHLTYFYDIRINIVSVILKLFMELL